jgi:hypothetical protein
MKSTFWMTAQEAEDEIKAREITLRDRMLNRIASNGYGVYYAQGTYMVADPLDGPDGFFLMTPTITTAYNEMCDAELLYA